MARCKKSTDTHGQTRRIARAGSQGKRVQDDEKLIPKHGGYENTKTWQLADLIYDVTVRFCDKYVDRRSRTHDQMVQSARSGCQNLQEGSVDSAVSKKIELKLTGIAKGSLKELQRDFEKFLKHRDLPEWPPSHQALMRFKSLLVASIEEFRAWVAGEVKRAETNPEEYGLVVAGRTDGHRQVRRQSAARSHGGAGPCKSVSVRVLPTDLPAVLAANGALSLLNLCIHLIGCQMDAQADAFEKEGGFTERLYRVRSERRREESH